MWGGINRRRFPRMHRRCLIHITGKDPVTTISTRTENIGAGGICVILNENLGLFQSVELELNLENRDPSSIKCKGTVVWVVKKHAREEGTALQYDTGIEFADICGESGRRIEKIVAK